MHHRFRQGSEQSSPVKTGSGPSNGLLSRPCEPALVLLDAGRDRGRTCPAVKQFWAGAPRVSQDHNGGQEPDRGLPDGEYREAERGLDEHLFVLLVGRTPGQSLAPQPASTIWMCIG